MTGPSTTPSTPPAPEPQPGSLPDGAPRSPSRRRFLGLTASGIAVGAAAATAGSGALDRLLRTLRGEDTGYDPPGADPGLVLVTVQLGGGVDFLDTVVPLDSGRYRALRRRAAITADRTVPIDDDYGLFSLPYVAERWHAGEVAIVHGVGYGESSLSHFVDTAMWERGSNDSSMPTGWLGRALDELGPDVDPLVGVGVGDLSPALRAPGWDPVAVPDDGRLPWTAAFVAENPDLVRAYGRLLDSRGAPTGRGMPAGGRQDLAEQVRASQSLARTVGERIDHVVELERLAAANEDMENNEDDDEVPDAGPGRVGQRLSVVAELITGGLPSRAYHVLHDGFDTHARQATDLPVLLGQLDRALRDFHAALGPAAERVVVATWTEFGRRPEWNGDGTDHGTAGTELVIGPAVRGGHHGEPVSLDRFDRDGNFLVTTDYRDYLGGLVQGTLGVDGSAVVPGGTGPMVLLR